MKVLQINSFFSVGGPPRIVNGIHDTLVEQGHECKIAAAREQYYSKEDSIRIGTKLGVYFNALSCRLFDDDGFRSKKATQELVWRIKEYDPDVIHLHNLHSYYMNIEILFEYLKGCGKPIFWTLHDCWAFTGHCTHFVVAGCEQWKTQCQECIQIKEFPSCYGIGNVYENHRRKKQAFSGVPDLTIITPSRWLANLVRQSFLGEYPVEIVNNGIDLAKFTPVKGDFRDQYGLNGKFIALGVAAVWQKKKGFDDFIKLVNLVDEDVRIVLVGVTEKQKKMLPKEIIGISKTGNIRQLAEIYSAADVFVNPTYEDTFPTVNIEALACGTPIITYNSGGSPEIANPENEIVCPVGDVKSLSESIREIKENKKYKNEDLLTVNSKRYSRERMTEKYIELYMQSIGGGIPL